MLLTITNNTPPASDLGFLLHKHPDHLQNFPLSYGAGYVFYPECNEARCTAALLLEINPIDIIRGRAQNRAIEEYVNDRPYVCSSFMSTALSKVFGTAMGGRSKEHQELANTALELEAVLSVVPCRGGPDVLNRLFEPLGYTVAATRYALDSKFPDWGDSPYYTLKISATKRLQDLLTHLYVMIPVLDVNKHYFIGRDEVEKLLEKGSGWLKEHPEKEFITSRYLKHLRSLTRIAMDQLIGEEKPENEAEEERSAKNEELIERKINLNEKRIQAVVDALKRHHVQTVADLGCGEGKLLKVLLKEKGMLKILGLDVSVRSLEIAEERLHLDRMPDRQKERISLAQGSLMYRDDRISGYDAITVTEVIEHMDFNRHSHFERVVFEHAHPRIVVVTTPNYEYNVKIKNLSAGKLRHADHRFEWTRKEFEAWAKDVGRRFSYLTEFEAIGDADNDVGAPTQMAVFSR